MCCAPEATDCAGRRGSSADIFSLGCVILELATVLVAPTGSLQRFKEYREDPIQWLYRLLQLSFQNSTMDMASARPLV